MTSPTRMADKATNRRDVTRASPVCQTATKWKMDWSHDDENTDSQAEHTNESDGWDASEPAAFLPIVGNVHRSRAEILASLGDVNPNGKRQKKGRRRKRVQRPRSIGPREQNKIDGYALPQVAVVIGICLANHRIVIIT